MNTAKGDPPFEQHLLECNEEVSGTADTHKLLPLEALHIWKERTRINTRDEFRSREFTLKL